MSFRLMMIVSLHSFSCTPDASFSEECHSVFCTPRVQSVVLRAFVTLLMLVFSSVRSFPYWHSRRQFLERGVSFPFLVLSGFSSVKSLSYTFTVIFVAVSVWAGFSDTPDARQILRRSFTYTPRAQWFERGILFYTPLFRVFVVVVVVFVRIFSYTPNAD